MTAVAILPNILDTPTNRRGLLNNDDDDDIKNNEEHRHGYHSQISHHKSVYDSVNHIVDLIPVLSSKLLNLYQPTSVQTQHSRLLKFDKNRIHDIANYNFFFEHNIKSLERFIQTISPFEHQYNTLFYKPESCLHRFVSLITQTNAFCLLLMRLNIDNPEVLSFKILFSM